MNDLKGQLTLRGLIVGSVGCAIITAASVYTALKLGALPWPIIFAAIISLFVLKALGHTNLNEVNVTHTVMSAGAMVAGGLAFTIPGIWILNKASIIAWWQMLLVALAGCILGLICVALLRRHFIERANLEYPIGEAAAQTLVAGTTGGRTGAKLFGSLGLAGAYTALRDALGVLPQMFLNNVSIPGVTFGIYNSPMMLAVGFLVGTGAVVVWFIGALIGNFGIIVGGSAAGLWSTATGQGITSSLGMGVMMGCGVAVVVRDVLPRALRMLRGARSRAAGDKPVAPQGAQPTPRRRRVRAGLAACAVAAVLLVLCFCLRLGPLASVIVVLMAWITTAMSAQSVGQTGIDPMEIFGLIVLLLVAATSALPQVQLFFVAGVVAVACGLAGDVMNDFKAGHILHTSPRAQWIGEAVGSIIGAVVAVAVICVLVAAYGPAAFGTHGSFVAAQASVVATMVGGIPCLPAFLIGLVVGFVLYLPHWPSMMLGLGIYLPFYMSFTAFLGAMAKVVYSAICKARLRKRAARDPNLDPALAQKQQQDNGLIISSGLLGGESIVGVIIALVSVVAGLVH
jgi:uncharacterized oligopeptide transporter (OPT) family protein